MKHFEIVFLLIAIAEFINYGETLSLNGVWTVYVENFDKQFEGFVPGGIYTDLSNANLIPDSFKEANDVNNRWVGNRSVTYARQFQVDKTILEAQRVLLVFDGLDTFATIFVNDREVGKSSNMFLRHVFDIKDHLAIGNNALNVTFTSAVKVAEDRYNKQAESYVVPPKCPPKLYNGECHVNHIRKMQASFSWDWGPALPSMGIWKKVELVTVNDAVIIESTIDVIDRENNWEIVATILCNVGSKNVDNSISGGLSLNLEIDTLKNLEISKEITLSADDRHSISLSVPKGAVELWWPNGYGDPRLYSLTIELQTPHGRAERKKRIGFRKIELVQDNLKIGRTFYFRVNDVPIFAKGSNWIPASVLPELSSRDGVIRNLLTSCREVNMNMLRVWGGGYYESDLFYDLADEYGIMIWQDFMFACAMYPTNSEFLNSVREEVQQNVERLKHHPSIVIWAGSNENEAALYGNWYGTGNDQIYKEDYLKLYVDVVKREVEKLDITRPFVVSSPSDGSWTDENGFIGPNPYSNFYGDVHYYNYLRNGWDINQYPVTRFDSEYGFQSIPSIETLSSATTRNEDLKLNSEFLAHRQHHPGGWIFIKLLISKNFVIPESNNTNRDFVDYIYLSQINQAVSVKVATESHRQMRSSLNDIGEGYTMGALYWQLNDVWQAPSWSSIDFAGRWKMLHYYAMNFFAPIIVSPRVSNIGDLAIYIISDKLSSISGCILNLHIYKWNSPQPIHTKTFTNITIVANGAQKFETFWMDQLLKDASCGHWAKRSKNCFIELSLQDESGELIAPLNYVYPAPLKYVNLPRAVITVVVNSTPIPGKLSNYLDYVIELESSDIALFVWLEVPKNQGRFSENGFHLIGRKSVIFHANAALTAEKLSDTLKITTLSQIYDPNH